MPAGTFSATLAQDGIRLLGFGCMAAGIVIMLGDRFITKRHVD